MKLSIGCGPKKREGWIGLDQIAFDGVDHVINVGTERWPFEDSSVDEAEASHFVEHLSSSERIHFCNELYRVLKPGGKCAVIVPFWGSTRAYGDPTHQWPPVTEFWFYYLQQGWRSTEAPHTDVKHWAGGFNCDFECTWGYSLHPAIASRNQEFQQFALNHYRESATEIHATLTAKK